MKKILWKTIVSWALVFCLAGSSLSVQTAAAEEAAADPIRVACVGDSLTEGYCASNMITKSYPARLQELLGDGYTVMNFGKTGATLLDGTNRPYKAQTQYQNSLTSNPDIVIIMLGTNDSKFWYGNVKGKEKFAEETKALVETYQNLSSKPRVVVATSPACHVTSAADLRGDLIENEIVPMQRQLILENGWDSIDMFALTTGKDSLYYTDGVHFSDLGYYYEAECMYKAVTGEDYLKEALPLAGIESPTQHAGNEAELAADDDYTTIWHSEWDASGPEPREKHMLTLELEERSLVESIRCFPRQDQTNGNGIITQYEIQTSSDGGRNYTKAAEGSWPESDLNWKTVTFETPVEATHVRLIAKAGKGGHTSLAEIRVEGSTFEAESLSKARENLKADYAAYALRYTDETLYEEASWAAFTEQMETAGLKMDQENLTLAEAEEISKKLRNAVLSLRKKEAKPLNIQKAMQRKFYTAKDNETILPYRIYLPEDYTEEKKYPLVLFLHGAGERGNDNAAQLTNSNSYFFSRMLGAERNNYPAIIVAPQCPANEYWVDAPWADGCYSLENIAKSNELQAVEELLVKLQETYSINKNRLYTVGFSMGAFGVWDLIMRNPDMFAAAIPIAGAGDPKQADAIKDIPIWGFHGENDQTVPCQTSTRRMAEALEAAGSEKMRYTEYPTGAYESGHLIVSSVCGEEEFLSWLFGQKKEMETADLSEAVLLAEQKKASEYTSESYQAFLEALLEAKRLLSDDSAQQDEINEALAILKEAESKLEKKKEEQKEDQINHKPQPITSLDAPQILSLSRKSKQISISWNPVANAAGYEVSYKTTGAYQTVPISGETASFFQILQTNTNEVYTFRVRAYCDTDSGRIFSEYSGKPAVSIPKPKIASVKKSKKAVCVKWKKVSGASGYQIMRRIGKKGKFKVIATVKKGKTVKYLDKKVKHGKKYYYKVCAVVNSEQDTLTGAYSAVKNVKF